MKDTSSESVAEALVEDWIPYYDVPAVVTTGGGAQFESRLFQQLSELLRVKWIRTISCHSVENNHRAYKPLVVLGLRITVKQDMACCPAELVYGTILCLPGEFFVSGKCYD